MIITSGVNVACETQAHTIVRKGGGRAGADEKNNTRQTLTTTSPARQTNHPPSSFPSNRKPAQTLQEKKASNRKRFDRGSVKAGRVDQHLPHRKPVLSSVTGMGVPHVKPQTGHPDPLFNLLVCA
ncbi:MAG: hypothetical protein QXI19_01925 [Candidatus Caldarchaeum sp.]